MSRCQLAGFAMCLPLLMAQMCGGPAPETFDRLAVNETLRTACPRLDDAGIQTLIWSMDLDFQGGVSSATEANVIGDFCTTQTDTSAYECQVCMTAILYQVYSE